MHATKPDPLWNKAGQAKKVACFKPCDFQLADDHSHCVCPAGKRLYSNGSNCTINGYVAMKFSGAKQDCVPCTRRPECLRTPEKPQTLQVTFLQGMRDAQENYIELMKSKIDSETGKEMITRRFATVEPVFGNLRGNKRLHHFTLRGKAKVDGQWQLYCICIIPRSWRIMVMRDKEAGSKVFSPLYRMDRLARSDRFPMEMLSENRQPKMKTTIWFEKIPPKSETGFQNGVFLQRR
ncbi:MAG: transposase [Candidatus Nitrotoga sp.]